MYVAVSFLGVQSKSKHFGENEKDLSFYKNFDLRFLFENILDCQSPYGLKHVIITFYLPHIFQYIPLKNLVNYFCFKEKQVSAFY